MRELHLVHGVKFKRTVASVLKPPGYSWTRTELGDWAVTSAEEPERVLIVPAVGVKYEWTVETKKVK
jgi:hypothetical protein